MMESMFKFFSENQCMMILMAITTSIYSTSSNPMKFCWKLMFSMLMALTTMLLSSGSSFMILIMTMMLIGGILMMYILMTSMMPNKKMMMWKMSKEMSMLIPFLIVSTTMSKKCMTKMNTMEVVLSINNNKIFMFMMLFISMYFTATMNIMELEKSSLRTYN